jgi:hypothetical protein
MCIAELKRRREERGLSLADVSKRSGLDRGMPSRSQNGTILNPTMAYEKSLAAYRWMRGRWAVRAIGQINGGVPVANAFATVPANKQSAYWSHCNTILNCAKQTNCLPPTSVADGSVQTRKTLNFGKFSRIVAVLIGDFCLLRRLRMASQATKHLS